MEPTFTQNCALYYLQNRTPKRRAALSQEFRAAARKQALLSDSFFFSSRRRHTRSVSAFLLNRSSDLNRAKKSGMVNITSSVNSRERSGINTILHELNPLFTINVTMRDIKSKNVYSRVNSKATTQWRKTESANGVHLEGVASDNR